MSDNNGRGMATSKHGRMIQAAMVRLGIALLVGGAVQMEWFGAAAFLFCLFLDTLIMNE